MGTVDGKETPQVATLAGGCFWCLEAAFQCVRGVNEVVSGYTGGGLPNPSYEDVCGGETGHAEAVQIRFDPGEISYAELLEVFFTLHDPTTADRQGNDVGTQYRSAIFTHSPAQEKAAREAIERFGAVWKAPIVTEVLPAGAFFEAEPYHQRYFECNPYQPYCRVVVQPKLAKLRESFPEKLKG